MPILSKIHLITLDQTCLSASRLPSLVAVTRFMACVRQSHTITMRTWPIASLFTTSFVSYLYPRRTAMPPSPPLILCPFCHHRFFMKMEGTPHESDTVPGHLSFIPDLGPSRLNFIPEVPVFLTSLEQPNSPPAFLPTPYTPPLPSIHTPSSSASGVSPILPLIVTTRRTSEPITLDHDHHNPTEN